MSVSDALLSQGLFGVTDFRWSRPIDNWIVFRNSPQQQLLAYNMRTLYHATTLSQCRLMLQEGFRVGLYHAGSKSSAAGIWGCSCPGHSVDRAPLARGWSRGAENVADKDIVCGWDCPVVLAWAIHKDALKTHSVLVDGTRIWVHKQPGGTRWDVRGRRTSIWIHRGLFKRFMELPSWWPKLQEGTAVACRSRCEKPTDLYKAGDAAPMTCARVCSFEKLEAEGWKKASGTGQWYCRSCGELYARCKPCTDDV